MALPTYITNEDFPIAQNKVLPVGSFVKPIDEYWLPKHIKDKPEHIWINRDKEIYCYCHFGIVILPIKIIRKV